MNIVSVNLTQELYKLGPDNFRVDLHRADGDCWTLENNLSETAARDLLRRFALFADLPSTLFGQQN